VSSSDARVRVVVADDHPFFRDGVIRGLTMSGRVEVVAEAGDGREALEAHHPTTGDKLTLYIDELEGIEVVR